MQSQETCSLPGQCFLSLFFYVDNVKLAATVVSAVRRWPVDQRLWARIPPAIEINFYRALTLRIFSVISVKVTTVFQCSGSSTEVWLKILICIRSFINKLWSKISQLLRLKAIADMLDTVQTWASHMPSSTAPQTHLWVCDCIGYVHHIGHAVKSSKNHW